jgi:hypothetical protein
MFGMTGIRRRPAIVISILVLAAAVLATGVVAGQFRGADPASFHAALATGEITRVADIGASDGFSGRGVFLQTTDTGQVCLWDAVSERSMQRGGSCSPADDPLGGSAISASLAYEGGPAIDGVQDARLIGLASSDVEDVTVLMSDGTSRRMILKEAKVASDAFQVFGYRIKRSDLRKGVGPTAIIAFDASGAELARQPTGIGG